MARLQNVMAAAMQPLWSVLFNREAFYRDTGHNCDVTALVTCFIFKVYMAV